MGKYHCTIDLLFDWFGLVCFVDKNKKLSVVVQLISKQSNKRSYGTVILSPLVFPGSSLALKYNS
jgi:hypothetical protein